VAGSLLRSGFCELDPGCRQLLRIAAERSLSFIHEPVSDGALRPGLPLPSKGLALFHGLEL
jgi:hypothetical protein